jgi:hypothetical protein
VTEYNEQLMGIDRKLLALETESGGLFSIGESRQIPAFTIRSISDFGGAGIDKTIFEQQTDNNARKVAALNASTFLTHQLRSAGVRSYLERRRSIRSASDVQLSFFPVPPLNKLEDLLVKSDEEFNGKLRALSPSFTLLSKGYRLPMPRVRIVQRTSIGHPKRPRIIDIRDALKFMNVATVHIPREYPDLSLSWIIARNLLSVQIDDKQLVPCVIEARNLQRPRTGIDRLAGPELLSMEKMQEVRNVFIIDEFDFGSKSRSDFLRDQIKEKPHAQFLIVTRSASNTVVNSDFAIVTASHTTTLADIGFAGISHFVQKNYEIEMSAAEVIAVRLRETFDRYNLSAHPSYFAGIPRNILNGLLRANRRSELIELAVAGYLSFVVAEDKEPIALSRTTREKFLTEVAFTNRVLCEPFTEVTLTHFAAAFAEKFDFKIAPARFVSAFFERGILNIKEGNVSFTLPFMEYYLLAKRLIEQPTKASSYFSLDSDEFDYPTFTLYAEMGAAPELVLKIRQRLDETIEELAGQRAAGSILLDTELFPALLRNREQTSGVSSKKP